ncbi:MAG: malto-oligosyltrehalose trehalohydrolase [Desulfuromonadales bacterium]
MQIGATYLGDSRCEFTVWAPAAKEVALHLPGPRDRLLAMEREEGGYWRLTVDDAPPGTRYFFRVDGGSDLPDPASCHQPEGVHKASAVIDHDAFTWSDGDWKELPPEETILYELHVGTFTEEGTFAAVIPRLEELRRLGVTAIELMPVAQFPGGRNWGYDGVHPFAAQNTYGGPQGLKELVDACHAEGLAVVLDVVYNHLGPEGNYLREFGPYFTARYRTPWGEAVNFDGAGSDGVRNFFIENALLWFEHYHVDALRLDAVHAIFDFSARPFLQELAEQIHEYAHRTGRPVRIIAESDLNDVRLIRPPGQGGFGLDGQWNDDFHHALHTLLTGEHQGYYRDFGAAADMAKAFREGFVYDWRYSPYRDRRHGSSSADRPARQFVVCSQNHDQVGNRLLGERLITLTSFEAAQVAAAVVLFSPFVPLLFMGEEYAEEAPFRFFVSFEDPELVEAVRRGRREEFSDFDWAGEPPDPQDPQTFKGSRLRWEKRSSGRHRVMFDFYWELIALRREIPALAALDKENLEADFGEEPKRLRLHRRQGTSQVICMFNFHREALEAAPLLDGGWVKRLDSAETCWLGPGASLPKPPGRDPLLQPALSCALYLLEASPA